MKTSTWIKTLGMAAVVCLLAGCTSIGVPTRPKDSWPENYFDESNPVSGTAAGGDAAQHYAAASEISPRWWESFNSPKVNALVLRMLAGSPSIDEAKARLREAEAHLQAQTGQEYFPDISLGAGAQREKINTAAMGLGVIPSPKPFTVYNASVDVRYNFDLFERNHLLSTSLFRQTETERLKLLALRQTLVSKMLTTIVKAASDQTSLQSYGDILARQQALLEFDRKRMTLGAGVEQDILNRQQEIDQTMTTIAMLTQSVADARRQLAVYAGLSSTKDIPALTLEELQLPKQLPLRLPSELLRRRPDVMMADVAMSRAGDLVGVSTANLFPQLSLSASYGYESLAAGQLFRPDAVVWNAGSSLLMPLFNGGRLQAERRAAVAVYDECYSAYKQTVLDAFLEVSNAMQAADRAASIYGLRQTDLDQRSRLNQIVRKQLQIGDTAMPAMLESQRRLSLSQVEFDQAKAQRLIDTISLYHAVGMGNF
ncbi:efflux transporter outer membrane subunit [Paludibacterium purpuratum]|uniref:NodT family efflux transporter outer membrane factor (OMF) lipoprotein n=1 Tax=Paludibacterium purpuratum TaxID=1144873 RepID=A0A4R7BCU3_9NEIS|nr:efflux transporter outer membrane subunit [Paludibacterium purpuratum]TDR81556.1 NodT family efflux transporter outer membrane factor (OMF) lipoprotein [Paludibacterium purpuratum]